MVLPPCCVSASCSWCRLGRKWLVVVVAVVVVVLTPQQQLPCCLSWLEATCWCPRHCCCDVRQSPPPSPFSPAQSTTIFTWGACPCSPPLASRTMGAESNTAPGCRAVALLRRAKLTTWFVLPNHALLAPCACTVRGDMAWRCQRSAEIQNRCSKPVIAQLVEHLTVELCSDQMVPGSIPGDRICFCCTQIHKACDQNACLSNRSP